MYADEGEGFRADHQHTSSHPFNRFLVVMMMRKVGGQVVAVDRVVFLTSESLSNLVRKRDKGQHQTLAMWQDWMRPRGRCRRL